METQQFYRPLLCEISWCLLPLRVTPVRLVRFDSKRVPECHFDRERPRDLFNIEMRVAILVTLMNDPWCGIPRASTFQSAPRSQSSSELWQVTRNGYCISFYFLHSDIKVKCEVFTHVIAPRRIHQIFIIRETFSFKIYIYMNIRATKCVRRRQTVAILENFRSFPARRYICYFYVWVVAVIVEPSN